MLNMPPTGLYVNSDGLRPYVIFQIQVVFFSKERCCTGEVSDVCKHYDDTAFREGKTTCHSYGGRVRKENAVSHTLSEHE